MNKGYPTLKEAEAILLEGAEYKKQNFHSDTSAYILHPKNVAEIASRIASKTMYLNPEEAYILALLHDYGRRIKESLVGRFHGQEGYDEMMKKGYWKSARICLTHTFPNQNFNPNEMGYPKEWMLWAQDKLKDIEYDDYDRLIQLCDKFCEEKNITSIEDRAECIVSRYKLPLSQKERLLKEGIDLKKYFDNLCGEDVYEIIGMKNEYTKI